jgi:hypothetical protein
VSFPKIPSGLESHREVEFGGLLDAVQMVQPETILALASRWFQNVLAPEIA